MAPFDVINRGFGGDITEKVLNRLDFLAGTKPSTVFLMIGTNDLGQNKSLDEIINNNYESIIVNDFLMLDENFNEISIFNTSGKKVVELENVFESKIDLSNLNKGVYFLQGRNKINNRTIKILKI